MTGNIFGVRNKNSNYEIAMYDNFTISWYKYQNNNTPMPIYTSLPKDEDLSSKDLTLAQ